MGFPQSCGGATPGCKEDRNGGRRGSQAEIWSKKGRQGNVSRDGFGGVRPDSCEGRPLFFSFRRTWGGRNGGGCIGEMELRGEANVGPSVEKFNWGELQRGS